MVHKDLKTGHGVENEEKMARASPPNRNGSHATSDDDIDDYDKQDGGKHTVADASSNSDAEGDNYGVPSEELPIKGKE